ncbi:hypothetical protein BGX26_009634 [Mortierella sp. AD094]|nr:hypothetical protein BGX26_009634 [Mortierella sp. AD094]
MSSLPPVEDNPQPTNIQESASPSVSSVSTSATDKAATDSIARERPPRITIPQRHITLPPHSSRHNTSNNGIGTGYNTQITHSPISAQPIPGTPTSTHDPRSDQNPPSEPLSSRPLASQTFAEGMSNNIPSIRRRALERMHTNKSSKGTKNTAADLSSTTVTESSSANATGSSTGVARPIMPRSRPSLTQFRMKDQPSKMIIPPPYGREIVQQAAAALAAGIPDGIPGSNTIHGSDPRALSDSESDDEPEVRLHIEIHLQEDAETEPICPLSDKNLTKLAEELELTSQERADVEAIQTKEELAAYFEKIPRDYDVEIIVSDQAPESPGVTFAQDDLVHSGDSIAVVRRETFKEKKSRRRKQKYRRPTTDLSTMPVEEPKASWLELFYDLLFVANLNNFTHSHPITGDAALGNYIAWFVIMWWAWAGQTFWAARYDMDDLFTKLWKLVEFCALISFGAFSSDHLNHTATGFIVSYIILKAVLAIEYGNVLYWARKNRSKKSLTPLLLQIGSNLLAMLVWALSIMVHSEAGRYAMWFATIAIEAGVLVSFGRRTSVTFAGSHLPERFALFTIIVLGENIIGLLSLSSGAVFWQGVHGPFLLQFLLLTIILYGLWWIYFDDFSEDIFHRTTTLSQLWAYLHLPLHICIVLVGTGALDLIRLYKEEHNITDRQPPGMEQLSSPEFQLMPLYPLGQSTRYIATGFEVPFERRSASIAAGGETGLGRDTDYDLTKQYFLVACSLVFLFNSLIKWINLRSYDRFQKIVYLSRLLNAVFILCLLAVPLHKMTSFVLLGSMALFCTLQVAVDLAVIYFGAYGFVEDLEAWARSARSSIDLGSFLPSPLGGRSRRSSIASSKAGSVVNLNAILKGRSGTKAQYCADNSTASLASPKGSFISHNGGSYTTQQKQLHQSHQLLSSHGQTSPLSLQQQQALQNMHINANSLGSSGAYGNLVQALAEIKKREQWGNQAGEGLLPCRQITLSATERGLSTNMSTSLQAAISLKRAGMGGTNHAGTSFDQRQLGSPGGSNTHLTGNMRLGTSSSSSASPPTSTSTGNEQNPTQSFAVPGPGATGLANLFNQSPTK